MSPPRPEHHASCERLPLLHSQSTWVPHLSQGFHALHCLPNAVQIALLLQRLAVELRPVGLCMGRRTALSVAGYVLLNKAKHSLLWRAFASQSTRRAASKSPRAFHTNCSQYATQAQSGWQASIHPKPAKPAHCGNSTLTSHPRVLAKAEGRGLTFPPDGLCSLEELAALPSLVAVVSHVVPLYEAIHGGGRGHVLVGNLLSLVQAVDVSPEAKQRIGGVSTTSRGQPGEELPWTNLA